MAFYPPKNCRILAIRKSPKPIVIKPIPQRTLDAIAARVRKTRDGILPPVRRKGEVHVDAHAYRLQEMIRRNKEYWNKK